MATEYPLWGRPAFVGNTPVEAWSSEVASHYCEWFVEQVPGRVALLLARLGVEDDGAHDFLARVQAAVEPLARQRQFWTPSVGPQPIRLRVAVVLSDVGEQLTDAGEALGLDVGVLLGRELQRTVPGLTWGVHPTRRRTYVSLNHPLLIGPKSPPYDPQLVGPTVIRSAIQGDDRPRPLPVLYDTWRALLATEYGPRS